MKFLFAGFSFLGLLFATHGSEVIDGVNRKVVRQEIQKYFNQSLRNQETNQGFDRTYGGRFRPGSNQGRYFTIALTPTLQMPNGEFGVASEGEDLVRMSTDFTDNLLGSAEVGYGLKRGSLRYQISGRWMRLNSNAESVAYAHPFLFPIGLHTAEEFKQGNISSMGVSGGVFFDFLDRSQGNYDESYYVGTSLGMVRSVFSHGDDNHSANALMHEIEVGTLHGLSESLDLQIAFQVLRVGGLVGTDSGDGTEFSGHHDGVNVNFAPYNRYTIKVGLLHFFARN